jgi:hypothetical protein
MPLGDISTCSPNLYDSKSSKKVVKECIQLVSRFALNAVGIRGTISQLIMLTPPYFRTARMDLFIHGFIINAVNMKVVN